MNNNSGYSVSLKPFDLQSATTALSEIQRIELSKIQFIVVRSKIREYKTYDLLDYFNQEQKDALKNGAPVLIENRQEGHSYQEVDYYTDLFYTIDKHNLDPSQFWYLSSNLKEHNGLDLFLRNNPHYNNKKINLLIFNDLVNVSNNFEYKIKEKHIYKVPEKSFCCFNHRPAAHRLMLLFKLFENRNLDKIYASCYKPKEEHFKAWANDYIDKEKEFLIEKLYSKLPLQLDTVFESNFETRLFDKIPMKIYTRSAACLVTETLHDDYNDTSLFYSEKTWKPMWHGLPILIVGQKGANRYLKENLGFELYEELFDYSFDSIDDMPSRIQAITDQVDYINKSTDFQKWKPLVKEKILYNRSVLEKNKFNKIQCQDFYNRITNR